MKITIHLQSVNGFEFRARNKKIRNLAKQTAPIWTSLLTNFYE